ncbi:MAG: hypothetical protein Q7R52_03565 [archaeon]|nr:hypothetical protein [archaeon]
MEESKDVYKVFERKKVLILTNSNFKFSTNNLKVLDNGIFFKDKFGKEILLSFSEIRLIQEVLENG